MSAGSPVNDSIVTVDNVPLDLMREYTLHCVALELLSNLLDNFSHGVVSCGLSNFSLGSLEGVPRGENHVSLAACDWASSNYNSSCSVCSVAIDVRTTNAISRLR